MKFLITDDDGTFLDPRDLPRMGGRFVIAHEHDDGTWAVYGIPGTARGLIEHELVTRPERVPPFDLILSTRDVVTGLRFAGVIGWPITRPLRDPDADEVGGPHLMELRMADDAEQLIHKIAETIGVPLPAPAAQDTAAPDQETST